ncbi:Putative disease resistance protein At4g11170 [Linum perenne]
MASSSYEVGASSSSSVPGYTGEWEFDVFVCFRGKDTRGVFTSHLAGHLREQGIRVFTDDKLERTEDIGELLSILARSAISVVIFSENFAESTWCLDEVATIAERMEHFGHRVLPVFYRVNPDDVSDDSGTYASTIDNIHKPNLEQKKRWMDALKAVTKRAGRTSNEIKDDYELHKTIVGDILEKLTCMSSSGKFHNLVGMDTRLLKVQRLLALNDDSSNDTHVIGFWGMGGLGKTTLATSLYRMLTSPTNRIKHHFFVNVKASEVEEQVQELYSTLLSQNNLNLVDLGVDHRRERLSRLKVVIVLDNVETTQQVEKLLLGEILDPTKLFGHGSVIIITSRNRGVLNYAKAKTYNVEAFDFSESLELFSLHAFRQRYPSDNLMDLSLLALSYCKGNPLAIKVLGGALFDKDKEYWKSFFHGLEKNPKPEIHDILSSSYHSLKGEEQSLFMDVVCFPVDIARTILITYLATSYESAYSIVEDLISKSLLVSELSNYNLYNKRYELIVVHDLLKEMAWNIVKAEPNPSRLKNPDDVCKLFAIEESKRSWWEIFKAETKYVHRKNAFEGGKVIQSLDLDLSKVKKELWLGAKAFEGMDCLRLLSIQREENLVLDKLRLVDGRLDTLPNELRVLYWAGFPSKCLPETFDPEKLVMLDLSHSQIEMCWEGVQQPKLVHLITLDLSCCLNLRVVPNLSACKKLEVLLLKGCKRLVEMPPHIQYMDKLVALDLSDCSNLIRLPAKLNSKCLEYVLLSNCPKVTLCPEINFSEASLQILDLRETPVRELPSAVHIVKQGGILLLCGKYITSFPRISKGLVFLRLCHTMITKMDVQDDDRSSELLPKFDELALVENSELESIPDNLHQLAKLELLSLSDCTKIQSLPQLLPPNLKFLYLGGCKSLQALPSNIGELNLQILEFDFCPQLDYELADKIAADFLPSSVLYSGSELPQWCSSNGSGANCEMELPPPSTSANNELAKGIAFGVVFSSCGLVLICLKMGTTVATFLSRKLVIHRGSRFYSSDYVLLWFDKNLLGETQKEEAVETPWYVKYAGCNLSFRVHAAPYSEVDVERVKKIKFKRFGVSLLY